jgi:hypothetical protein
MRLRRASRTLAIATASMPVLQSGCYEYRSTTIGTVRPAETIQVTLSPEASRSLAATIGPNATTLDGRVLAIDSNHVRLAVTQIARAEGPEEFLKEEPIDVPKAGAFRILVRSLDRPRTWLAFGGLVTGIVVAGIVANQPNITTVKTGPSTGSK